VVSNGVNVNLSPAQGASGAPGDTFDMVVTNTGTVTDTYNLSLGGPAALAATLASTQTKALAPGESQTIAITTTSVNFAVPGALSLTAIATSQGNPAVQGADTTALTVPDTVELSAQLTPSVKVLPVPGTTSFLLEVQNTGNTEDTYTATITGTTGPLVANLAGLTGLPTQTISLFRIPGLSTAAILVNTDLMASGTGTVSVQVKSLSHPSMTASATAQVSARAVTTVTTVPTQTSLTVPPVAVAVGNPVAVLATVTAIGSGTGTPSGQVIFVVDGVAQAPVPLIVVNGMAEAALVLPSLSAGTHAIAAVYTGAPGFAASPSTAMAVVVNPVVTPPADGPQVSDVLRYGYHMMPTEVVLDFTQPLDPSRAQDVNNYRIVGPLGRQIGVKSAVYDAALDLVILSPAERLNVHDRYGLTVNGLAPNGLTDTEGLLLDGAKSGHPGSNFTTGIDRRNLVFGTSTPAPTNASLISRSPRPATPPPHLPVHKAAVHLKSRVR
jgi:hypothetical protein